MSTIEDFENEKKQRIESYSSDKLLKSKAAAWLEESFGKKYTYNFSWMGLPIIQYPSDMFAMQEIIWELKPDLIIETGIAHGGSIIYYASLLEMMNLDGKVVGVDIDIREHNKKRIESHPMYKRITLIEGSSISNEVINQLKKITMDKKRILVCLDSYHTHEHVLKELELYSQFVTKGSYIVVFDTLVEYLPNEFFKGRPWKKGNNPHTAVKSFLKVNNSFAVDKDIENKLIMTSSPDGYLKKIK